MKYFEIKGYEEIIQVSRVGVGSAMSMMSLSEQEFFDIYDAYVDAGGNYIDTAKGYGLAEARVAHYIKSKGVEKYLLKCSKGCHPNYETMNVNRLSAADMQEDIDSTLKTFGTDIMDIYWIHKDDESIPVERIIDDMNRIIIKPGKAKVVGCSNWHTDRIQRANDYAKASGQCGFLASQIQWALAETKEEYFKEHGAVVMDDDSYKWYEESGMPIFAFSSQAQGFFPRLDAVDGDITRLPEMMQKWFGTPENLERYRRVKEYADKYGVSLSAPALAYLTNNKVRCVPIVGAMDPEMLKLSLSSEELPMTSEQADALYII